MENELFHYQRLIIGKGIGIEVLFKDKVECILDNSLLLDNGLYVSKFTLKDVMNNQYYNASEKANEYATIQNNLKFYNKMCNILGFGREIYMRKFERYFADNYKNEGINLGTFIKSILL